MTNKNGNIGGDPLVEETQRISSPHSQDESSTTPTDPELGDKRKCSEKSEKSHTKRKVNRSSGVVDLGDDDYNLISDKMEDISKER